MVSPVVSLPSTASRRTRTAEYSDEEHPDDEGTKGNKKGRPVLAVVKQASLAATALLLVFTIVIVLDAYKFVSVRHAKFARKKLLRTLQYMDPSLIEAHTGMKVLTKEEFEALEEELKKSRSGVRDLNVKVQEKFSAVLKTSMEVQNMKGEIEEMRGLLEEEGHKIPTGGAGGAGPVAGAPADAASAIGEMAPEVAEPPAAPVAAAAPADAAPAAEETEPEGAASSLAAGADADEDEELEAMKRKVAALELAELKRKIAEKERALAKPATP